MVFARDWFSSRLSVCSSPHLAKPFSVSRNFTKMSYREINLSNKTDKKLFEYFRKRIINEFRAEIINEIQNLESHYSDFKINENYLTLHSEIFTGISIFPTKLENATESENNSTEYYALKLICSENPYANFVTLKDGAKIRIDILLDNILLARADKGKFELKNRNSTNLNFEVCDICEGSFDEYWKTEENCVCKNCFTEFIEDEKYFEKLRKMNREEIIEF